MGSPYLNEREIRQVACFVCGSECAKGGGPKVMPIFVTEEITEDPRVDEFREKIHKEYDGLVLRTDLPPRKDIPDSGAYTYAHIPLIPDFVPQRQKPFRLQGERLEAHKKVTQDWADHWFIERPPKGTNMEWLSVTFVVPKKGKDAWRGWLT